MNAVARAQLRLRLAAAASGALIGSAAGGLALAGAVFLAMPPSSMLPLGAAAWLVAAAAALAREWPALTRLEAAMRLQDAAGGLDNLVVTAEEIVNQPERLRPALRQEVLRQAEQRLESVNVARAVPLARPTVMAVTASAALFVFALSAARPSATGPNPQVATGAGPAQSRAGVVRVSLAPPAYTGRASEVLEDPREVRVVEGTRVRVDVTAPGSSTAFVADRTRFLVLRITEPGAAAPSDRMLPVFVEPDRRPTVRVTAPGHDLMLPTPAGQVTIEVEARDDLGLSALSLRYTQIAGSGESFTFEEGEWPMTLLERTPERWRARTTIAVPPLKLEDGDAVVYRAIARDAKPGADPTASESYLIEIGALGTAVTAGSAIPEERDRIALSQQMVIVKTERLLAEMNRLTPSDLLEQARMLAIEQRMVKAEFVFMTGGEVEDEVEEATHSHELAEGRMENEGQAELLTAIREMSRAEARLNEAAVAEALTLERAALKALQRAFDRRRYFLRTVAERARIDATRRLTGDRETARSSTRPIEEPSLPDSHAVLRAVLRELVRLKDGASEQSPAEVAARVAALDPGDGEVQAAARGLSSAQGAGERGRAVERALAVLGPRASRGLPAAPRLLPGGTR